MSDQTTSDLREEVRARYAEAARAVLFALAQIGIASTAGTTSSVCSWGDNTDGQLGLGGVSNTNPLAGDSPNFCPYVGASGSSYCSWTPQPVLSDCDGQQTTSGTAGPLTNVYDVSAGGGLSLALLADGHVCSWGDNTHGELGIGTGPPPPAPNTCTNDNPQTSGPPTFTACALAAQEVLTGSCPSGTGNYLGSVYQISAGDFDALVLVGTVPWAGGTVCSWGDGAGGALGDNDVTSADSSLPVPVWGVNGIGFIGTATCISMGYGHGLAVLDPSAATDGTLVSWGDEPLGATGQDGFNGPSWWPVTVPTAAVAGSPVVAKVSSISAGLGAWNLYTSGTAGCMNPPPAP